MKLSPILLHGIAATAIAIACACPSHAAKMLPQMVVTRVDNAPVMDGKLDDSAWAKAPEYGGFTVIGMVNTPAKVPTYVKSVTDGKAIYVGFRCVEPGISGIKDKFSEREGTISLDESVEMTIDPTGDGKTFYHLISNIYAQKYAAMITTSSTGACIEDINWTGVWDTSTSRSDKEWYAEIRIPLSTIGADLAHNSLFRANFNRTRGAANTEYTSWSTNQVKFVETANMGEMVFPAANGTYCAIGFPRLAVTGTGLQNIPLDVVNHTNSQIRPKLDYKITGTQSSSGNVRLKAVPAGTELATALPLKFDKQGVYNLHVTATDSTSGAPIYAFNREIRVTQVIDFDEALYALYQNRADASIRVRIPVEGAALKVSFMKAGAKSPIAVKVFNALTADPVKVSFSLAKKPMGTYLMRAELVKSGKSTGISYSRNYPYKPNPKIGFDKYGFMKVDGKPFFPIGIYNLRTRLGTPDDKVAEITEDIMQQAKAAGFNSTVLYDYEPSNLMPLLDSCQRNDIKAFVYPTVPFDKLKRIETPDEIRKAIDIRRNHPAVLGWYVVDEPEGIGLAPAEAVRDVYQIIKEYDQDHPCELVIMSTRASREYRSATDIMWADPYPLPDWPVTLVSDVVSGSIANIEKDKPMWLIAQAYDWTAFNTGKLTKPHRPNPDETRCMTYLGLVNGAKGMIYWAHTAGKYYIRDYPEHWDAVKRMAKELGVLTPALTTPSITGKLSTSTKPTAIQTMLKKVDGEWYTFAVNSSTAECSESFRLPSLANGARLDVLFEGRSVSAINGGWTDTFKPLEVHVYKVAAK